MSDRIIVVGAGMGGLAAALDLAAAGREVVVLERARAPGGKLREVDVGGLGIDSGPTVFTMRWVFEALFEGAGADFAERVPATRCEVLARHAWRSGGPFDLFADEERTVDAIGAFAGRGDAAAYRRFCRLTRRRFENLRDSYIAASRPTVFDLVMRMGPLRLGALFGLGSFTTMWRELEKTFSDVRLRQLFGRYATYCGSSPFATPATLMLVAHVERDGVWLVDGGMHRLARALASLVNERGGRIRYGQGVRDIVVRDGRARGVVTEHGQVLAADTVLCNADAAALGAGLFGAAAARAVPPVTRRLRSLSAMTFSFLGRTRGFPLTRHNVFFSDDYPEEFRALFGRREVPGDPTTYLCAQDRPGGVDGPERLFALINAPADGDVAPFDAALVEARREATFSLLADCGLEVEPEPRAERVTTPAVFDHLFPGTGGALYGRHLHGTMGSFCKPASRTRLPGLYLAGGGAHPGAGIPMATLSGRLAAAAVLEDHRGMKGRIPAAPLVPATEARA